MRKLKMLSNSQSNHLMFKHNYHKLTKDKIIAIIPRKKGIYYQKGNFITIVVDLVIPIIYPRVKILKKIDIALNRIHFNILKKDCEYNAFYLKNLEHYIRIKDFSNENEIVSVLLLQKISEKYGKEI